MPLFSRPLSSRSGGTLLAATVLSRDSPRRVAAKSTTSDHTVTCPSWCTPCAGHSGRVEDCVSRPPDTVTQNHAPGRGSRRTLRHACAQEGARNRSRRSRCREDSLQGSRHHIAERIVPAQLNARRRRTYCGANRRVTPRADRHVRSVAPAPDRAVRRPGWRLVEGRSPLPELGGFRRMAWRSSDRFSSDRRMSRRRRGGVASVGGPVRWRRRRRSRASCP